jgi:hypothetical protein
MSKDPNDYEPMYLLKSGPMRWKDKRNFALVQLVAIAVSIIANILIAKDFYPDILLMVGFIGVPIIHAIAIGIAARRMNMKYLFIGGGALVLGIIFFVMVWAKNLQPQF